MGVVVLGPVEVRDAADMPVRIPRAQVRALLAALVIERGRTVSRDRLIDVLWGDRPPPAATTSLHSYISQLRRALGDGAAVIGEAGGYRLEIDAGLIDAARFEQLAAAGRAAVARIDMRAADDRFGEALGLWRGQAYGEFADRDPFRVESERLAEARLTAVEDYLDVRLGLGDHAAVVGEVESLLVEHPLRERLWVRLLIALYRSGRQADALAAYQRVRTRLVEELGLEPGAELRQLEQRILVQDPTLDYQPAQSVEPVRRTGPYAAGEATVLVGRQTELAVAADAIEKSANGQGRVLVVAGEAGIGKTSLCERIADEADARGAMAVLGRCVEGDGAPPLWPWIQILRALGERLSEDQLRLDVIGPGAADLVTLEPRLSRLLGDPSPSAVVDDGARFRQFDALTCLLQEVARTRPLTIVLDDVHRADPASLLLLAFVANAIGHHPILVVAAHRDTPSERSDDLRDTLGELARTGVMTRVELTGLDQHEVGVLIGARAGRAPIQEVAAAVHHHTEGNPFFVSEVVSCLNESGPAALATALPPTVRDVIAARVGKLSKPVNIALRAASVLGRRFDAATLELVAELAADQLAVALDEAAAANLLVTEAAGRWRFVHALVGETLYAELTPGQRVDLHRRAAEAIEKHHSHRLEPHYAELAHHHRQAATPGHGAEAVRYSLLAGDYAMRRYAFEDAVASYQHALDTLMLDQPIDPSDHAEILIRLGEANRELGRYDQAEDALVAGADAAKAADDLDRLARAVLGLGWLKEQGAVDQRRVALYEEVLHLLPAGDSPTRARALIGLTVELFYADALERRRALIDEAVAMARRLGDCDLLADALVTKVWGLFGRKYLDETLGIGPEVRALVAHGATMSLPFFDQTSLFVELTSGAGCAATLDAEIDRCEQLGSTERRPHCMWMASNLRTMRAIMIGDLPAALALYSDTAAAAQYLDNPNTQLTAQGQMIYLALEYGFPPGSELPLVEYMNQVAAGPMLRPVLAFVYAVQGNVDAARAQLETVADDEFAFLAKDMYWAVTSFWAGLACARIRDRGWCGVLYNQLLPHADKCIATLSPALWYGPISWPLGELAALLERWDAAETHFAHALGANERMEAQPSMMRVKVSWADMLEHRCQPGDADRAAQLYAEAQSIVDELNLPEVDWRPSARWPTGHD